MVKFEKSLEFSFDEGRQMGPTVGPKLIPPDFSLKFLFIII